MLISENSASFLAAAMLREFEGLSLALYFCPAGKPTIGYGHVILPGESELRRGISRDTAEYLLMRDLAWAMFEGRNVGRVLSLGQEAALASLIYNIGPQAWRKSTIKQMVVAGDMAGAAGQFKRWNKAGGVALDGLTTRRLKEQRIFEGQSWTG